MGLFLAMTLLAMFLVGHSRWMRLLRWREVAPGIELRQLTNTVDGTKLDVVAARAEPAQCQLRVVNVYHNLQDASALSEEVCPRRGAAINASFFGEDLRPLGLLIADGRKYVPPHTTGAWGVFWLRHGRPGLVPTPDHIPDDVTQAVQCKPRLVIAGMIPRFKQQVAARRSAVGLDAHGRIILAASRTPMSLDAWARCLRDQLGCVDALNLDGGPSTQLAVRGRATATVPGGWGVPVFLTVESTAR